MARPLVALPAAVIGCVLCAGAASANPSDWNRPYGQTHADASQPYPGARSRAGNRVVINGVIQTGVGVSAQASAQAQAGVGGALQGGAGGHMGFNQATAIGNQLNVVVQGNYNVVVVNSRQTNTGQINANAGNSGQAAQAGDNDND
ncbi:holdfast attachment protein HfaA [Alkalicaulis satelles]|uniref:Holdfast attachment protein HfaA n=1 Tax=Alkalicaulis satelles TaxID=2609175 RepID=A0A5M6ZEX8_9PROT|nr:holdfast anchoring protein HfaA [Alkalicaulis satelles]KAA5803316.1 holdfast attachment protein HfaA [Alkalicaulis satelles]